jgi:HNH endonuclease/AP2 domain
MDIDALRKALNFDMATGTFTWLTSGRNHKIGDVAGCVNAKGYRYIGFRGVLYRANRLAWVFLHGEWPKGQIDHINGDRDDNRASNLRDVTGAGNQQNRRQGNKNSKSSLLGVSWHTQNKKWRALITVDRKTLYLGCFETEHAAHLAYLAAKAVYHRIGD